MTRLLVRSFAVSLDGFGAGPDQDLQNPLGVGGPALFDSFFHTRTWLKMHEHEGGETGPGDDMAALDFEGIGAWILGRNMFGPIRGPWPDESWKGRWGDEPPYHIPVFVLTHHQRAPLAMAGGTEFRFVTGGIHAALEQAKNGARLARPVLGSRRRLNPVSGGCGRLARRGALRKPVSRHHRIRRSHGSQSPRLRGARSNCHGWAQRSSPGAQRSSPEGGWRRCWCWVVRSPPGRGEPVGGYRWAERIPWRVVRKGGWRLVPNSRGGCAGQGGRRRVRGRSWCRSAWGDRSRVGNSPWRVAPAGAGRRARDRPVGR